MDGRDAKTSSPACSQTLGRALVGCLLTLMTGCQSETSSAPATEGEGGGAGAAAESTSGVLEGDQLAPLPHTLAELGIFPDARDRSVIHERAVHYEPRFPLWTNGSDKERLVITPEGEAIREVGGELEIPMGTLFFKTFSYDSVPIETRVIRREPEGYTYSVYLWNEDASDAELADGASPTRVLVEAAEASDGESFEHEVPSRLECRTCHESARAPILGFELPNEGTSDEEWPASSELEREVLGYFQGNCVHCHNGLDGPSSAFSLKPDVAIVNLVGVETTSELASGLRVTPGEPEESALYLAITREAPAAQAQPMPPIGVQRRDEAGVELIREWIESLER